MPQAPNGTQLQVTPALSASLATVAVMDCVALTCRDVGTALSVIVMLVIVMAEVLALTLELSASVAVMTTGLEGTVEGAV